MSDYIPNELLSKILTFLPAKSLVRFASVCKSWQSLITSSDFITTHLNQTRVSNDDDGKHLILLRYYAGEPEKERYSLYIDNDTFDLYKELDFPLRTIVEPYFRVLGSCNGLICLADDLGCKTTHYILWNPSIRKSLTLPVPRFTYLTHGPYDDAIGFGFDSQSNDYKVVRLFFLQTDEDQSPIVELFKLSTGSWETISATIDPCYWVQYEDLGQVFVNGAVHWNAYKRYIARDVIMSFDMSDEVFHEIKLPACYDEYGTTPKLSVALCGEWLSFIFDHRPHSTSVMKEIWVMKEYGVVESWTKLYTFGLNGGVGKTVGFKRNGEVVLAMKNRELVSYDAETGQIKYLGICEYNQDLHQRRGYSFYLGAYEESLVLLGYGNRPGQDCKQGSKRRTRRARRTGQTNHEVNDEEAVEHGGVCRIFLEVW